MSTGQADIDRQHQEWIQAFNQFEQVVQEGKGIEALRDALVFFAQYGVKHFALEEARMASLKCPAAETNRIEHARFRKMISVMQNIVLQGNTQAEQVAALQMELANWLIDHICTVDAKLRAC